MDDDNVSSRSARSVKTKKRHPVRKDSFWSRAALVSVMMPPLFMTAAFTLGGVFRQLDPIHALAIKLAIILIGLGAGLLALTAPRDCRHAALYVKAVTGIVLNAAVILLVYVALDVALHHSDRSRTASRDRPSSRAPLPPDLNLRKGPDRLDASISARQPATPMRFPSDAAQPVTTAPARQPASPLPSAPPSSPTRAMPRAERVASAESRLSGSPVTSQPLPVGPASTTPPKSPSPKAATPRRGDETAAVGGNGGSPFHQDRRGKPVLGLIHRTGRHAGHDVVAGITALFSERDPTFNQDRTFARPGYAVGGVNVEADEYVTALQVVFMKIKNDHELDATDQYTSEWIGFPKNRDAVSLHSEGPLVIGIHGRRATAMNAIGLVLAE